ncbi:ABC transporter permease [Rhizobium sp. CNPSo 3968]|uniref:ABC transporter permease n=1 Tax=Rhizobium sp. CNPSo 3968 TaxID=3021408 RepID=UPI00254DB6AD|nr:ABC transporter permease [Rhizobium sp. CNPSo 3968]MDK4717900.1 ABC transporter permease [Rhizobium sp. CNPSo 3968]
MTYFVARRILAALPVMFLVALIAFSLLYFAPGDPAAVIAGDMARPADIAAIRESLGLDQPFHIRLGIFLWNTFHGNLGTSIFSNKPVITLIAQRLEPTLSLAALTIVISIVVAVPLGTLAAWRARGIFDRFAMAVGVFGFSVPVFVIAYLMIWFLSVKLAWFPVQGYTPLTTSWSGWLYNLILPALSLSTVYTALITRITRASVIEVLSQDYIRTARSKGLSEFVVLWRHALRNAAVPIATIVGIGVALLMGGVVVTETAFAIPGLGRLLVDAILQRDYPVIQGVLLLLSAIYVTVNLLVDISYAVFDPRIRN